MTDSIVIDIAGIIRSKTGKTLPAWVARLLERLIHQNEINDFLLRHKDESAPEFLDSLHHDFDVEVYWLNPEDLPKSGRYLFACNHPLGAFDGIGISRLLYQHYGDVRYMVNDMLYNLRPLQPIFLPVNTYGAQKRSAVEEISRVMAQDLPIATFPAGYCSRKIEGVVQDIPWHKSFINLSIQHQRDIIPLHFVGQNSSHFYWIDRLRKLLGIKFDIATALLPDEMFRCRHKRFAVIVGKPIPWQSLVGKNAKEEAGRIRAISYNLPREFAQKLKGS